MQKAEYFLFSGDTLMTWLLGYLGQDGAGFHHKVAKLYITTKCLPILLIQLVYAPHPHPYAHR
jgi:hypothetical protein